MLTLGVPAMLTLGVLLMFTPGVLATLTLGVPLMPTFQAPFWAAVVGSGKGPPMVTTGVGGVGAACNAGVVAPPLINTPMRPSRNKPPQTIDAFFSLDIFVVF